MKSDRWFFPSNIGSENWWFTTNDLFQFSTFAMIVTIKPFKDDQAFSGDGIDRSQSSHWNLQICALTLSGIFVTKNCKKYPRQNLGYHCDKELEQKFIINKILEYLSVACVLPREGQMRRRIIRADGSLFRFFTKNQTSYEIISFAFWPKGAYDDVWSWHFACRNNGPKKVGFCGSLDNCPWVRVTL